MVARCDIEYWVVCLDWKGMNYYSVFQTPYLSQSYGWQNTVINLLVLLSEYLKGYHTKIFILIFLKSSKYLVLYNLLFPLKNLGQKFLALIKVLVPKFGRCRHFSYQYIIHGEKITNIYLICQQFENTVLMLLIIL